MNNDPDSNQQNNHNNDDSSIIYSTDLYNRQYSLEELERNIDHLNHKILLSTQRLTAEFCVKHILDLNIKGGDEDTYLFDVSYILERQPHLNEKELRSLIK